MKPIAVIYIPDFDLGTGERINTFELAQGFNGESEKYKLNPALYGDYLWFVFPSFDGEFNLEVFYPKDFSQIQYNELKQMLQTEIDNIKK